MSKEKPVMGYIRCPVPECDEIATVYRTAGTRRQFYTKCPSCGCDQRNGARHQAWIQNTMQATEEQAQAGNQPKAPEVPEAKESGAYTAPEAEPLTLEKSTEQAAKPEAKRPEPQTTTQNEPPSKLGALGAGGLVGLILGGLAAVAA